MVELPACRTHNPVILSSSPTLATCYICFQSPRRAKKVVSNSLGLVDFAIRLVIFVLNLPNGQVLFFGHGEIQITEGL